MADRRERSQPERTRPEGPPSPQSSTSPGTTSDLQPGDVVYFDYNASNGLNYIDHAGIYLGGGNVLSAISEKYGIGTHSISWYQAGGLHFVGAKRYWSGGEAPADGSFVQVSGSPAIYRIVGGAPLYVSTWTAFGGSQPVSAISQQQFDSVRAYPADGTFISSTADGRCYEVAGGAPEYISAADASNVPGWGAKPVIGIDQWDIDNTANPAAHLRPYPVDGTVIYNVDDGRVYVTAGGAPEYVSAADASHVPAYVSNPHTGLSGYEFSNYQHLRPYPADGTVIYNVDDGRVYVLAGGAPEYVSAADASDVPAYVSNPHTGLSGYEFSNYQHLRPYPSDGTLLSNVDDGRAYVVAGGAPEWISAADASRIPGWGTQAVTALSGYEFGADQHLRPYPADGTFLVTTSSKIYRVAGQAPFPISRWSVFGGIKPYVTIDQWDVDNAGGPYIALRSTPVNGTVVEGLPSDLYWLFTGGYRSRTSPTSPSVQVDDIGLNSYPQASSGGGSGGTGGSAGSAGPGPSGGSGRSSSHGAVCVVPRLHHMTLSQARRALLRAHCRLGHVRRPRQPRHGTLRVNRQSSPARSRHRARYAVNVRLAVIRA